MTNKAEKVGQKTNDTAVHTARNKHQAGQRKKLLEN